MEVYKMKSDSKHSILQNQPRSFMTGTVEYIDSEWIFFDEETDEASMLNDILNESVELYVNMSWEKGLFVSDHQFKIHNMIYRIKNGDKLRVTRKLPYAYEQLLKHLKKEAFHTLTTHLNSLNISLYDCIYCHNTLCFLPEDKDTKGANFLIFDNEEIICSVQHLFERGENGLDRFEYTLSDGNRSMNLILH